MKKTLLIVIVALLLVPVVLYLAAPELLVGFAIDLERKSAGLSKGSVVVGDHTVVFTLTHAAGYFPGIAGMPVARPQPEGVVVDGIENIQGLQVGKIDIETDRIVIWTARLDAFDVSGESSGARIQPKDAPLEFYMEGNIVFRQGDRVIYADRMYYDIQREHGVVLSAEMLTPVEEYEGLLRLKADVLQVLGRQQVDAFGAAVTSSRMRPSLSSRCSPGRATPTCCSAWCPTAAAASTASACWR